MAEKENQRVKLTKQLLKNSLIELMRSNPINKITIKEICMNADINRSTFYLYYSDQFTLLKDIESEALRHIDEHLKKIDSDFGSVYYLEALLEYIEENSDIFRILLCSPGSLAFNETFIGAAFDYLRSNFSLNCPEKISGYVYNYLINGSISIIKDWIESGFDVPRGDMARLVYRLSDKATTIF